MLIVSGSGNVYESIYYHLVGHKFRKKTVLLFRSLWSLSSSSWSFYIIDVSILTYYLNVMVFTIIHSYSYRTTVTMDL